MDFGAVMIAACVSGALATLLMGLHANYRIALALGMGQNFYFVFTVCGATTAGAGLFLPGGIGGCVSGGIYLLDTVILGIQGEGDGGYP